MLRRLEPLAFVMACAVGYFVLVPAACAYVGARGLALKLRDKR